MTHVFGLTGGIGSGKSTVANRFRARGLTVLDADQLAREAVEPGTPALGELVRAFGDDILEPDGHLDRKRLAARVFGDEQARQQLNSITHPRVRELSIQRFAELDAQGHALACYEVPLLVESGLHHAMRPVVVVSAPVEVQLRRTMSRDHCTEAEARARIDAQMPLSEKVAVADHVIDNGGDLDSTLKRADEVLDAICAAVRVTRLPAVP